MALRDQPYIPLYIQDFMTDEKLAECSAETTGVYIRLMCVMHKSDEYGTILLKQKNKQTTKQVENFARQLAKHMPYRIETIHQALHELIDEGVIDLKDSKLLQYRMIRDNITSKARSEAGQKGGFASAKVKAGAREFAKAKTQATSEYEYEYEDESTKRTKKLIYGEYKHVRLTLDEYNKLRDKFGKKIEDWVKTLDEGIELKGYKYKSHYLAILKWAKNGEPKKKEIGTWGNHLN